MDLNIFRKIPNLRRGFRNRNLHSNRDKSNPVTRSSNDYSLIEIECNHDINSAVRREIDEKYQKSSVNATYRFPRIQSSSLDPASSSSIQYKALPYTETTQLTIPQYLHPISSITTKKPYRLTPKLMPQDPSPSARIFDQRNLPSSITPNPYSSSPSKTSHLHLNRSSATPIPPTRLSPLPTFNKSLL